MTNDEHHWEPTLFVPYSKVSLTQELWYISSRCGMRNCAVEHNVGAFLRAFHCCMLARKTKQGLVL